MSKQKLNHSRDLSIDGWAYRLYQSITEEADGPSDKQLKYLASLSKSCRANNLEPYHLINYFEGYLQEKGLTPEQFKQLHEKFSIGESSAEEYELVMTIISYFQLHEKESVCYAIDSMINQLADAGIQKYVLKRQQSNEWRSRSLSHGNWKTSDDCRAKQLRHMDMFAHSVPYSH